MTANAVVSQRRYDLDWLRVLAMLSVFVFHSLRFFNLDNWHVKNLTTYPAVQLIINFMDIWIMPLMFLISGFSLFYALRKGGAIQYIKDKTLRLLVPLVVGVFTHASLQVYLERITHGQFEGSYFEFLPHYFDGIYMGIGLRGNFAVTGMHLWYLLVLFMFSLLLLPLSLWIRSRAGARIWKGLGDLLAFPGGIYLLALAVLLSWKLIAPDSFLGFDAFNWNLGVYLSFLLAGMLFAASDRLQTSLMRLRWVSLLGAVIFTIWVLRFDEHDDLAVWSWLLAFCGFGMKHLNFSSPGLKYANEAVLPFYILHQTVLLCVGYFVVGWPIPSLLKWLIIAPVSFGLILGLYEFFVRRVSVLRFLFGMKVLVKAPAPQERKVALAR